MRLGNSVPGDGVTNDDVQIGVLTADKKTQTSVFQSVRLRLEDKQALKETAEARGLSVSALLRSLIQSVIREEK